MKQANLFWQYIWLVNTIHQAGKISLKEINQLWLRNSHSDGVEMHRNTFNRHKTAIEDLFDINIGCDPKDGHKYFIENSEVLREDSIQNWLLSSIAVHTTVQESSNLRDRILLEDIPSGQTHLQPILEAMKAYHCIDFTYQKYGETPKLHDKMEPYCLKLYKQRWYLLTQKDGQFRKFSLDRIKSLEVLEDTFQLDPGFHAEAYFRDCYGVYGNEQVPPQRIVLRAFDKEVQSLRDLPLHHSQREIATHADHSDFSYFLCPSNDFIGQILRQGIYLKVLEPQTLQDKIRSLLKEMQKKYE